MNKTNSNVNLTLTEFDFATTQGMTQMLKAMLPYLEIREQKMLGIMIRIWELISTIRYFSNTEQIKLTNNFNAKEEGIFNRDMILHIKKYCTPENQQLIDNVLNFMNAREAMNFMNSFDLSSFFDTENLSDDLKPFCDGNCDDCDGCDNRDSKDECDECAVFKDSSSLSNDNMMAMIKMLKNSSLMNPTQQSLYEKYMDCLNNNFERI